MSKNNNKYLFLGVIARVSLSIFLVSTVILVSVLLFVFAGHDGSYEDFIRSQLITQKNIQLAILIAGLILIMVTTLITWLIVLYASFKVAGPLFRFSENMSNLLDRKYTRNIREGDSFQELSVSMLGGIEKVEIHKQELNLNIDHCNKLLSNSDSEKSNNELPMLLNRLKEVDSRVKLND